MALLHTSDGESRHGGGGGDTVSSEDLGQTRRDPGRDTNMTKGVVVALRPRTRARRLSFLQKSEGGAVHINASTQTAPTRHVHTAAHGHVAERTVEIHNLSSGEDAIETVEAMESGTTCAACCDTIAPDVDTILRVSMIEDFDARLEALQQNPALRALQLDLTGFSNGQRLTSVFSLPPATLSFETEPLSPPATPPSSTGGIASTDDGLPSAMRQLRVAPAHVHPPNFVQPHPPHQVFSAPIIGAHRMTGDGASKRVYHMSIDVSEYPLLPGEHWLVGGSFGMCAANDDATVHDLLTTLGETIDGATQTGTLRTSGGRWPTVWGDEQPRTLQTSKYELLKWCSDISSSPIKKSILRVLAEYASDPLERQILFYLVSRQGQDSFCNLRGGQPITLAHLLAAFPSSRPPLAHLVSVLPQLYPRWYSLSSDPEKNHGTLEFAFTVAEVRHYLGHERPGVGSGFLETLAKDFIAASERGDDSQRHLRLPMFRGLHANPFTKDFADTGPMILIGAGVGIAPFRGFVQRRVSSAKCADKVYVIQGCRDSQFDGIYGSDLKSGAQHCIVESQAGRKEYVQDEVVRQGELIWRVMTQEGGRTYVCGAAKGFLQGIEKALRKVAMKHGKLDEQGAKDLWKKWQDPLDLRLILEVW